MDAAQARHRGGRVWAAAAPDDEWRALPPHGALASAVVHAATLVYFNVAAVGFCVLVTRGLISWARFLKMVAADGAVYLLAVLVLRSLGPLPPQMCYPPGSLSLPIATLRALVLAGVLPLAFTESNRLEIAKRTGLTHVRIRLENVHVLGTAARDGAGSTDDCNSTSDSACGAR